MCIRNVGSIGDTEGTGIAFTNFANSASILTPIIKEEGQSNLGNYMWQFIE